MQTLKRIIYITLVMLATSVAASPVFKVSKGENSVYIGGTFHILTADDFPLQDAFYKAYKASDTLYFETDIQATKSPRFQALAMPVMLAQNGETIKTILSSETFDKLREYCQQKGLPIEQLMPLSATGLMLSITLFEYQTRGFTLAGVDEHLFEKGKADNKTISWFESIEQQIAFLDSFDDSNPDELIAYVLDSSTELDTMVHDLHSSWRMGDMDKLEAIGLADFAEFPDVYNTMIKDRNDAWMQAIGPMFASPEVEFILVGALHLPGKDGLLTQLEAQGFLVSQVK